MTAKCVLALWIAAVAASSPEPEPAMTTGTTGTTVTTGTTGDDTTTTTTMIKHVISLTMTVSVANLTNMISFLQNIQAGVSQAANGSGTVTVVLHYMSVTTTFSGIPSPVNDTTLDQIIQAYSNVVDLPLSAVKGNNQTHSSVSGGRRLSTEDVAVEGKIVNNGTIDVVQKAKSVAQLSTGSALQSELASANPGTYAGVSLTGTAPTVAASVTSEVTGVTTAPVAADVQNKVQQNVPGSTVDLPTVQTVVVAGTTGTTGEFDSDESAPIASMTSMLVVAVYAFMMS